MSFSLLASLISQIKCHYDALTCVLKKKPSEFCFCHRDYEEMMPLPTPYHSMNCPFPTRENIPKGEFLACLSGIEDVIGHAGRKEGGKGASH